ncbi:DUF1513 domain-containing protein [Teredinibacter sp. KSP-S5-2]|uniref:DUF1513 domain-containing protein n=1 Tax=Teredinibacter sp. KSP-S5-2 TaxID=3034506 RepID=UPI002934D6A1|nr:DUF1513 domain-containing protein [Teredinibacter sp. KSP-S5-2]WNO10640.1 DUF1513 domain-containing protein [Teredinibacter sp. KSP-S5-2]
MKKTQSNLTRRKLIHHSIALGLPIVATPKSFAKQNPFNRREYWVSAQGKTNTTYGLGWFSDLGVDNSRKDPIEKHSIKGPVRGHGVVQHPTQSQLVVMVGRRPSQISVVFNIAQPEIQNAFRCVSHRFFTGHGCFSDDGTLFFAAEENYENGEGVIGVYDGLSFRYLTEFPSYGLGPHEIKLMPNGHTLVIANGGLVSQQGSIVNLHTMNSNLAFVDSRSGKLIETHKVDHAKASLRHIDIAKDGTIAVAIQVQRQAMESNELVPLAAIYKPGRGFIALIQPETVIPHLKDYMGSVAINGSSRLAGFTSPRGNLAVFWDIDTGGFKGYHSFDDVCGIALSRSESHFILSSSSGQIRQLDAYTLQENKKNRLHTPGMHWDNHLIQITV